MKRRTNILLRILAVTLLITGITSHLYGRWQDSIYDVAIKHMLTKTQHLNQGVSVVAIIQYSFYGQSNPSARLTASLQKADNRVRPYFKTELPNLVKKELSWNRDHKYLIIDFGLHEVHHLDEVEVNISWITGPLGATGYRYSMKKVAGTWTVVKETVTGAA